MTRAKKTDLVLDGNEVKLRLTAERLKTKQVVHVDWVRFTCSLRAALLAADKLFPRLPVIGASIGAIKRPMRFVLLTSARPTFSRS